jgi:hypothetical protein
MLIIYVKEPINSLNAIKSLIKDKTIKTWECHNLQNGNTRFDWIGGGNNWPNLDKNVYFEAVVNIVEKEYIRFNLHTKQGHKLNEAEYAQMHSELTGMLFSHLSAKIEVCGIKPSKDKTYNVDIIDKQN